MAIHARNSKENPNIDVGLAMSFSDATEPHQEQKQEHVAPQKHVSGLGGNQALCTVYVIGFIQHSYNTQTDLNATANEQLGRRTPWGVVLKLPEDRGHDKLALPE